MASAAFSYNQISKGGSDSFHGSAYEYFQNDAMNAYSYDFGGPPSKDILAITILVVP